MSPIEVVGMIKVFHPVCLLPGDRRCCGLCDWHHSDGFHDLHNGQPIPTSQQAALVVPPDFGTAAKRPFSILEIKAALSSRNNSTNPPGSKIPDGPVAVTPF